LKFSRRCKVGRNWRGFTGERVLKIRLTKSSRDADRAEAGFFSRNSRRFNLRSGLGFSGFLG
jgi:hypothetical protein